MVGIDLRPVVVKVGGSLLRWDGLRGRLAEFLDSDEFRESRVVLIAGGGIVADAVRTLDAAHGFGDVIGHRLALRAMDVTAYALAALVAASCVVDEIGDAAEAWTRGVLPILAPRRFLQEIDERGTNPLPLSWSTTSDSIAARIAVHLDASRLVLLKSESTKARDRREAVQIGHVDPMFAKASAKLEQVESVNLRAPGTPLVKLA